MAGGDPLGGGGGGGSSFGSSFFTNAAGAVGDVFAGFGYEYKAKGARIEQENYLHAAEFADKNVQYTDASTRIKEQQEQRSIYQTLGGQSADVAGAGFAASGSALDLLRDSAAQGALTKGVLAEQGQITEEGYRVQAASLRSQAEAAGVAAEAADTAATGSFITGAIKGVSAVASLLVL